MSIRIIYEKRYHLGEPDVCYPAFFCELCGERIYKTGNVLYRGVKTGDTEEEIYNTQHTPYFFHKECSSKIDKRNHLDKKYYSHFIIQGADGPLNSEDIVWGYWMELKHFAEYLKFNLDPPEST